MLKRYLDYSNYVGDIILDLLKSCCVRNLKSV